MTKRTLSAITGIMMFLSTALLLPVYATRYTYSPTSAGEAAVASTFVFVWVCCFAILGFGVNFVISYFVYRDAQKNKVENPALWAVITFFFTLIGLLIYLLAIRPDAIRAQGGSHHSTNSGPIVDNDKK